MMREAERKLVTKALALVATGAGVAVPVVAAAASRPQPLAGTYSGTVNGTGATNHGIGCFEQKPTVFGKRVKPANDDGTRCRDQIIAPSLGPVYGAGRGCNRKPAVLESEGFPIQKARFHYKGRARIGRHDRRLRIDFRGHWVKRTKVVGATRIRGGGCASVARWTMRTPPHGS